MLIPILYEAALNNPTSKLAATRTKPTFVGTLRRSFTHKWYQLPVRLARFLQASGYDTIHTRDLPQQNATSDHNINAISIQESRILITKDSDFVNSLLTIKQPYKLLLIATGNINNSEL